MCETGNEKREQETSIMKATNVAYSRVIDPFYPYRIQITLSEKIEIYNTTTTSLSGSHLKKANR